VRYLPYPEYLPVNGTDEVRIPLTWETRRLKFAASCNDEALPETTDPDYEIAYVDISSVDLINGITAIEFQNFEEAPSRARRIVRHGDIFGKLMSDGEFRRLAMEHLLHKVYGALKGPEAAPTLDL
jgi:hypothetical protein